MDAVAVSNTVIERMAQDCWCTQEGVVRSIEAHLAGDAAIQVDSEHPYPCYPVNRHHKLPLRADCGLIDRASGMLTDLVEVKYLHTDAVSLRELTTAVFRLLAARAEAPVNRYLLLTGKMYSFDRHLFRLGQRKQSVAADILPNVLPWKDHEPHVIRADQLTIKWRQLAQNCAAYLGLPIPGNFQTQLLSDREDIIFRIMLWQLTPLDDGDLIYPVEIPYDVDLRNR